MASSPFLKIGESRLAISTLISQGNVLLDRHFKLCLHRFRDRAGYRATLVQPAAPGCLNNRILTEGPSHDLEKIKFRYFTRKFADLFASALKANDDLEASGLLRFDTALETAGSRIDRNASHGVYPD
jgi:hypothetical protein